MLAREGRKVMVFDTDPSMNLAMTLGLPYMSVETITGNKENINREIDENEDDAVSVGKLIIDKYSVVNDDGIRVIVMGAIPDEGNGCLCSAISIIKMILSYIESDEAEGYDVAIVDSQAGPEILGRGLAKDFDYNLIMTEPTLKSAEVSKQVALLAENLGVRNNLLIVNKSESEKDLDRMSEATGVPRANTVGIRYDRGIIDADRESVCLLDAFPDCGAVSDIRKIRNIMM